MAGRALSHERTVSYERAVSHERAVPDERDAISPRSSIELSPLAHRTESREEVQPPGNATEAEDRDEGHTENGFASPGEEAHGIDYRPLAFTVLGFATGLALEYVHHRVYSSLDRSPVGSDAEQRGNLRLGNLLALGATLTLAGTVRWSLTQRVWRVLRRKSMSIKFLSAVCDVAKSPLGFLDRDSLFELLWLDYVIPFMVVMVLVPSIPQLLTPQALTVRLTVNTPTLPSSVPSLGITDPGLSHFFAWSRPGNSTDSAAHSDSYIFEGARTILTRLSVATGSSGTILDIPPPSSNSSYSRQFPSPYVQCAAANSTAADIIEAFVQAGNQTLQSQASRLKAGYYTFVPSYGSSAESSNTITVNGVQMTALDQPRLQQIPRNATNELWMKYWQYETDMNGHFTLDSRGSKIAQPMYSVCELWNATYSVGFLYEDGVQIVGNVSIDPIDRVAYPGYDPIQASDLVQHAYTAFFSVLTDQLVGTIGLFGSNGTLSSSIDTQIARTVLIGSTDFDYAFDLNHQALGVAPENISFPRNYTDQRLLDIELAHNKSLLDLVPQFSFNTTMSLLSNRLLAPPSLVNTTQFKPVNQYHYNAGQLIIPYIVADILVLVAFVAGVYALHKNGASYDNSATELWSMSPHPSSAGWFLECRRGKQRQAPETLKARVRAPTTEGGGNSLIFCDGERPECEIHPARSQS